jgi:hypothetical protein
MGAFLNEANVFTQYKSFLKELLNLKSNQAVCAAINSQNQFRKLGEHKVAALKFYG